MEHPQTGKGEGGGQIWGGAGWWRGNREMGYHGMRVGENLVEEVTGKWDVT